MSKNEYYIPTINEFHIGFNYEQKKSGKWQPLTLDAKGLFKIGMIENWLISNKIRVKRLTGEDIVNMSFSFNSTNNIRNWYILEGNFETPGTPYKITKYVLMHDPGQHYLHIEGFFGNTSEGVLFEGHVNNINEFQKILKQINIK